LNASGSLRQRRPRHETFRHLNRWPRYRRHRLDGNGIHLLWAVISLSEPQRSQFVAAVAGRQMMNQGYAVLAKAGQSQPTADPPSRPARTRAVFFASPRLDLH
jgi:hypothetical protein